MCSLRFGFQYFKLCLLNVLAKYQIYFKKIHQSCFSKNPSLRGYIETARCPKIHDFMSAAKRPPDQTYIQIACTPDQKDRIKKLAKQAGAKTLNQYALPLLLNGDTEGFAFAQRNAEGALVTADVYRQLRSIAQTLKTNLNPNDSLIQEAIEVVNAIGRDIALARLATQVEQSL